MATNKLTSLKVDKARNPGLLGDGGGLYLRVTPSGTKNWVFRYTQHHKAHWMGLGPYPQISLADARRKALEAWNLREDGADPIKARRDQRASRRAQEARGITFRECAERYIEAHQAAWKHPKHVVQWRTSLANYVHPIIGDLPVDAIDTPLVMKVLEPNWTKKAETMTRIRGRIENILDWAKVRGHRSGENPALWRGHLSKLLPSKGKVAKPRHFEALPYGDVAKLMVDLRAREGVAARALEFTLLTAVRVNEAIGATWPEIQGSTWVIPAERMKGGREHRVPLSRQALEVLDKVRSYDRERVFPEVNNDGLLILLRKQMKAATTIHGFRSTFRDWAGDCTGFDRESHFAVWHASHRIAWQTPPRLRAL
jgi:integrase